MYDIHTYTTTTTTTATIKQNVLNYNNTLHEKKMYLNDNKERLYEATNSLLISIRNGTSFCAPLA